MLAGTHMARAHAIRRGHDGAIRRFERRIRARVARRASPRATREGEQSVGTRRAGNCRVASPAPHATSRSPRASGGQPGARARLKKHATPAPRRERDAEARARGAEACGRDTKKSEYVVPALTLARDARERGRRAPKHEREERDGKVSLRRERRTCGVVDGAGARTVCLWK